MLLQQICLKLPNLGPLDPTTVSLLKSTGGRLTVIQIKNMAGFRTVTDNAFAGECRLGEPWNLGRVSSSHF